MSTSCDSCSYNCSETPSSVCPYTDITGIGVVISYALTAFAAVVIVIVYYFFVFLPNAYPFQNDSGSEDEQSRARFRPNSIDTYVLRRTETKFPRLGGVLTKCTLTMSDMQIVTGISILVSGYTQLPCGLSAYHWQVVVSLAWFSSLTHLSCLTVLRSYLYKNPGERLWRWIAMALIVIMLVTAIVPTGNFGWLVIGTRYNDAAPQSYAICSYKRSVSKDSSAYHSMVISVLLIIFGFLNRVVKLHKGLSVYLAHGLRSRLSSFIKKYLCKIYNWCGDHTTPRSLRRLLVYRPLLSIFLACRVSLDFWSSMFLEVLWLTVAFWWGFIRLVQTLQLYGVNTGRDAWKFGQVVPLVLLAAPLITFLGFSFERENQVARSSETIPGTVEPVQTAELSDLQTLYFPATPLLDDPNFDIYQEPWFRDIVFYVLWMAYSLSINLLTYSIARFDLFFIFIGVYEYSPFEWIPLVICWVLICLMLLLITIEDVKLQFQNNAIQHLLLIAKGVVFAACSVTYSVSGTGLPHLPSPKTNVWLPITLQFMPFFIYPFVARNRLIETAMRLRWKLITKRNWSLCWIHLGCLLPTLYLFSDSGEAYYEYAKFEWLYLVIPPSLYVTICFIFWGLPKVVAFLQSFRRNQ